MGAVWLGSLPYVLGNAGLTVSTWPGWEVRSRGSGGYDDLRGIGIHHDGAPAGTSLGARCSYAWQVAPAEPIGAVWLHTDGSVMVGAAGATNTQGRGGPVTTSRGVVPLNAGNRYLLSIEASNDGVGEVWPQVQQDAYVTMCEAICEAYGLDPSTDIFAHFEWAPRRKYDPAGPSRYANVRYEKWNMDRFRSDVSKLGTVKPPPLEAKEIDMIILDLNPDGNWVAMNLGDNNVMHIVNGHHVAVMERGGVPRVEVNETEVEGILRSVATMNDSPFAPDMPSANPKLDALWAKARSTS